MDAQIYFRIILYSAMNNFVTQLFLPCYLKILNVVQEHTELPFSKLCQLFVRLRLTFNCPSTDAQYQCTRTKLRSVQWPALLRGAEWDAVRSHSLWSQNEKRFELAVCIPMQIQYVQ